MIEKKRKTKEEKDKRDYKDERGRSKCETKRRTKIVTQRWRLRRRRIS